MELGSTQHVPVVCPRQGGWGVESHILSVFFVVVVVVLFCLFCVPVVCPRQGGWGVESHIPSVFFVVVVVVVVLFCFVCFFVFFVVFLLLFFLHLSSYCCANAKVAGCSESLQCQGDSQGRGVPRLLPVRSCEVHLWRDPSEWSRECAAGSPRYKSEPRCDLG